MDKSAPIVDTDKQLRLAACIFNNVTEGIMVCDPDGTITSVNPAFCDMSAYSQEELVGQNSRIIKSNRHTPEFFRAMRDEIDLHGYWQGEIWNRRKHGEVYLDRVSITAIRDNQGQLQQYVAVHADVAADQQSQERIQYRAYHDALTDLPNRLLFLDRLRQQLAHAHRQMTPLAVLFINLDGFTAINEELGHDAGDDLLKEVAVRLKYSLRETDTVARMGGDEFSAILTDLNCLEGATLVAQKMLDRLALPVQLGDNERCISASIGISFYPAHDDDADRLLKLADAAMGQAKQKGKGTYVIAEGDYWLREVLHQ